jgi:hypothetical protein
MAATADLEVAAAGVQAMQRLAQESDPQGPSKEGAEDLLFLSLRFFKLFRRYWGKCREQLPRMEAGAAAGEAEVFRRILSIVDENLRISCALGEAVSAREGVEVDDLEAARAALLGLQQLRQEVDDVICAMAAPRPGEGQRDGASAAVSAGEPIREQFGRLVRQWKEERGPTSSARRMAAHPAYRAIVGLGKPAVPLLLAELERQPDHWFIALHELTGANPVPESARGRVAVMAAAWVQWGKEHGLIP